MEKILNISLAIILGGLVFFVSTDAALAQASITSSSPLPRGTQNQPYSFQFQASGAQSYAWQAFDWVPKSGAANICGAGVKNNIPPGLTLNTGGLLTGTPTQAGNFGFMVVVNDNFAQKKGFCIVIDPPSGTAPSNEPLISAPFPPNGTVGQPYNHQQTASGGTGVYAWSIGNKPSWLNLTEQGLFYGTPIAQGTHSFLVEVLDSAGKFSRNQFSITIDTAPAGAPGIPGPGDGSGAEGRVRVPRDQSKCPQTGLVPCGTTGCPCEFCDIFVLTNNVLRWTFTWVIPTIAVLMLMIGGILFFFAGAKSDVFNQAKGIVTSVIIGLLIIFAAWVIINTVFDKLGFIDLPSNWKWYKVGCAI